MTELFTTSFATHYSSWAGIHTLMNMMLAGDERRIVFDKVREEANQLHLADPDGIPEANLAVLIAETNWDPNNGGIPLLEHCRRCILTGLQKGMQSQKQQMISVRFQGKPFNTTISQGFAPSNNIKNAEVEWF